MTISALIDADQVSDTPVVPVARQALALAERLSLRFAPGAAGRERFPALRGEMLDALRASGLQAIQAGGASHAVLAEVVRLVAKADASAGVLLLEHYAAVGYALAVSSPSQREKLASLLSGGDRLAHASGARLQAVPNPSGLLASGKSDRALALLGADWVLLVDIGDASLSGLITRRREGLEISSAPPAIGLRGCGSAAIALSNVLIRHDELLQGGDGATPHRRLRDFLSAAAALGIAEAAIADTATFAVAHARPWYEAEGKAIGEEHSILYRMGQIATELRATRVLLARAARLLDQDPANAAGAVAELAGYANALAVSAANELFAVGGASAADSDHGHDRHWRDARALAAFSSAHRHFLAAGRHAAGTHDIALPSKPGPGRASGDPLLIASEEQALAVAREYAVSIAPGAAERDRSGGFPTAELRSLAATGLLGITVPRRHGGGTEASLATVIEVMRIISRADSSIGQVIMLQFSALESVHKGGTEEQQRLFFAHALRGARFGNAAAERAVAHAKVVKTRLSRNPDGYRLNGSKYYSTGAPEADWVSILALDDQDRPVTVLVPRGAAGFQILDDWDAIGQRGTGSGTTILDNVAIDPIQILPPWFEPGQPSIWAAVANIKHVAVHLGAAEAAFDDLVGLIRGHGGGAHDAEAQTLMFDRLGRLAAKLHAGQAILRDGSRRLDALEARGGFSEAEARAASLDVTEGKVFIGEAGLEIADQLLALAGEAALDAHAAHDRHWRNLRTHTLHDPNRWRYIRAGDFLLNGRLPPANRNN